MPEGRVVAHVGEAIVLRTWPFLEADLLVSLFTRQQGRVKGVARHAMRSRRRFGGALEPMTMVRAAYAERPKQELVRLDAFEIVWSPLSGAIDWERTAALQMMAEVLEEALPELAVEDAVFRLTAAVLPEVQVGPGVAADDVLCLVDVPPAGVDAGPGTLRGVRSGSARDRGVVVAELRWGDLRGGSPRRKLAAFDGAHREGAARVSGNSG